VVEVSHSSYDFPAGFPEKNLQFGDTRSGSQGHLPPSGFLVTGTGRSGTKLLGFLREFLGEFSKVH